MLLNFMELLASILSSGEGSFGVYGDVQITHHIRKVVAVTSVGICLSAGNIEGFRCFETRPSINKISSPASELA